MRYSSILVTVLITVFVLMTACGSQPSKPTMKFETIGTKGSTVLITLVSPSPDEVSAEDLANRLKADWQDQLIGNMVEVWVFDNKEAPQRWLSLWDKLASISDQEWTKEQSQIFPHWVAKYAKNKTTGFHQVDILSRDEKGSVVRTIKF